LKSLIKIKTFFLILLLAPTLWAYIPRFWLILSRTAENHGKGMYLIDQDVVFNHGEEPIVAHEQWMILDEKNMRLRVTGKKGLEKKLSLTYVYDNGRRFYVDENGVRRVIKNSDDWFEHYFHFRFSKNIKPQLLAKKIIPPAGLKKGPSSWRLNSPPPPPEDFVRLTRATGVITYGIGTPTPINASEPNPGLWIEQDRFVVSKLRLPSRIELVAKNYKTYARGLKLPLNRELLWDDHRTQINLTKVKGISNSGKNKERLSYKSLNFGKNPELSRVLPEDNVVRDFYTRFR
jgi:hypothetical protein